MGVVGVGQSQSHKKEKMFFLAEVCEFGGSIKRMFD